MKIKFPSSNFGKAEHRTFHDNLARIVEGLNHTSDTHGAAARRRTNSSQNGRGEPAPAAKRFKPVGFNVRDDGEGLANSGNKLAHVVNLANFNERKAVTRRIN